MYLIKKYSIATSLSILVLVVFAVSCEKKKGNEETPATFNKATLLENVATNIIVPAYQNLDTKLNSFQQSYNAFIADQTPANFDAVRTSWKEAYGQWEQSLMFDFGPAMSDLLKGYLGTFPSDTTKILNNIASGSYNLMQVSNITAQGLPAFDFLLYRKNAISYFNQQAYAKYGTDLIAKMREHLTTVLTAWNTGYTSTFISSTGTETTSSFSQFVNEFVKSYEECKWTKIGIPIGKQSMGVQMPEYIETRYSKQTFEIMRKNISAIQRLFNGNKENGTEGTGFDDYLNNLEKSELAQKINSEFTGILTLIDGFTGDFETTMTSNPAKLDELYNKVHALTVYLKTDMTSAFGIMITYQDNDGD